VAWQEKEEGVPYIAPYFLGDRLVEVRKMPCNLTVRFRSTGKLMGRLALPDLQYYDRHPLFDEGPRAVPVAHDGRLLALTDSFYYYMVDVVRMKVLWKRLIDANDLSRQPPMRFELNGEYLAVVKQDYDVKAIYMLSSRTGEVLWKTDPKNARSPQPLDSVLIRDGKLYGIRPHPGQAFYFVGMDCKTGKNLFRPNEQKGYGGKPLSALHRARYGSALVVRVKDRQDFEMKAFDGKTGKLLHKIRLKAAGDFGTHGRASETVCNGSMVLLGESKMTIASGP
jgi:hypothetical protein